MTKYQQKGRASNLMRKRVPTSVLPSRPDTATTPRDNRASAALMHGFDLSTYKPCDVTEIEILASYLDLIKYIYSFMDPVVAARLSDRLVC